MRNIMLSVWYAKYSPVAFVFKGLNSPLQFRRQRPALISIAQYWQDKWLVESNILTKTDSLMFPVSIVTRKAPKLCEQKAVDVLANF